MTTVGKRSSPKKNKSFKMKFSPKKYHSPKKTVKENIVKDNIAVLQKFKKAKGNRMRAEQTSPCIPLSFRTQRKGLPKSIVSNITTKKAHDISSSGSPEALKQTKNMSGDQKKLSALDATEDVVPSFELCAEFGFTGKKARVARELIRVQRAFNRLRLVNLPSFTHYVIPEFRVLYRKAATMGSQVVGQFKLWDQFELEIIRLLEMRLVFYKVPHGTLFNSLGYKIALWDKTIYHAGSYEIAKSIHGHQNIKLVPGCGLLKDLADLAITLHEQIEAVKEIDRVDGATEFAQKAGYY